MKQKILKKLSSLFGLLLICISTLAPSVTALAETGVFNFQGLGYMVSGHATADPNVKIASDQIGRLHVGSKMVYCVDPGTPSYQGSIYESAPNEITGNDPNSVAIRLATVLTPEANTNDLAYAAVQAIVWEACGFTRTSIMKDGVDVSSALDSKIREIQQRVENFQNLTSWNGKEITLKKGESITVPNTLADPYQMYEVSKNDGNLNVTVNSDNSLTISANSNTPSGVSTIEFDGLFNKTGQNHPACVWKPTGNRPEQVLYSGNPDPYHAWLNIRTIGYGNAKIKKIDSESGKPVPGTKFDIEYSGEGAPKSFSGTTDEKGEIPLNNIQDGVHVKATETFVPEPYVLGSTIGESDVVEGDIVADQTIVLTQKNKKQKGQVYVQKSGQESGKEMWNGNYTLDKTTFELRKDKVDGPAVDSFTTDSKGDGNSQPILDLGTYYLVETQAGQGFANTFEPQKIDITYEGQTIAVVIKNAKGTNQEVVGTTLLTKEDAETGKETQGAATFDGAVYGLFHKDGTPVKWSENFKPVTSKGNKLEGDEIKFEISDKEQQASVEHLALGDYYWQELVAPEGYQIDNAKRSFSITYKDQNTKVIETKTTSKENVIKFNLDGFKYVDSKSGDTKSGYNGLEFKLTPINPTKGEERTVETVTDENGYDGYWAFKDVPFGDYWLTEVKAPEGYKTINPLKVESNFNKETREYVWTITEKDQKEPIKTLTVSESKINEGSNVISLSKLFFTNKLVKAPQISTMATVNGENTFTPSKETPMHDKINLTDLEKDGEYTLKEIKLWEIHNDDYANAKVVYETAKDFVADKENMEQVVEALVDTSKADENTKYVWTEKLYKDGQEVANHEDLKNEDQTVRPLMPNEPKTETLFATVDGKKEFDIDKDTKLIDKVSQDFPETEIGKIKYWVHDLHSIDKDGKDTVIDQVFETKEVKAGKEEFDVAFEYIAKKHKLKDGEKLVVTHTAYNDEDHKDEYVRHFDLTNEKQTVTGKKSIDTPEIKSTPTTPTTQTTARGFLPQTAATLNNPFVLIAALALIAGAIIFTLKSKKGQVK